jgi:TPR repeat protein
MYRDVKLAGYYLKMAADQEFAEAQFIYGQFLLDDESGRAQPSISAQYLKLAAEQGCSKAQLQ